MMELFKTVEDKLVRLENIEDGAWINLINPTEEEAHFVSDGLKVDIDYIKAALDEEESSRIETDNGNTLIIVDIPLAEVKGKAVIYTTIPLGIVLSHKCIVTICLKENPILKDFIDNKIKTFCTFKKTRFILQILHRNATKYLQYLKQIDKISSNIESRLQKSTKNKELIQLLDLEKSLVYFNTSLKANEIVLEKMLRTESIKNYPEDAELLEDVIIENKQAIEMAKIYSDILTGMMGGFASVISNNLNIIMKYLTTITIIMAIPTMISSFFGMNVRVPMQDNPYAFAMICVGATGLCLVSALIMWKNRMF